MNSPLQLETSRLLAVELRPTSCDKLPEKDLVTAETTLLHQEEDMRSWRVVLKVQFGGTESKPTAQVCGVIDIEGDFRVHEEFPEDTIPRLVSVNGASILFGSAREIIAGLSGRMGVGVYLLPSVSFYEPKNKTPRKKAKSAATRKS